jgi:hypothetical protein
MKGDAGVTGMVTAGAVQEQEVERLPQPADDR